MRPPPRAGLIACFIALTALAMTAALAACGGDEPPPPPLRPVAASAERLSSEEGLPLVRSLVRVRFDGEVRPVTLRALAGAFRLAPPEGSPLAGHALAEMVVVGVEVTSSRTIELTVAGLVIDGAMLHLAGGALAGAEAATTVAVESEFTELGVVLAGGVLAFGDLDLVRRRPPETPMAADRDPAAVRAALEEHLTEREASAGVRRTALALYDGMDAEVAPAPKVRAALAALAGTFADAAVRSLLGPENCTGRPAAFIGFREPPEDPDLAARMTLDGDGRRVISIRPDLEAAPFELLMPLLAHEAVHCDELGPLDEEIVASALDVFLYIHLLISQPELARDASPLARNFNIEALAMLNSGRARPESLGVLASPHGLAALPDSGVSHRSFADLITATYTTRDTARAPVEPVAQTVLDTLAQAVGAPLGSALDLAYVDLLLGRATTRSAIATLIDLFDLVPR